MNEMYIITVLMLYTLLVLSEALLSTYRLLMNESNTIEDKYIYPKKNFTPKGFYPEKFYSGEMGWDNVLFPTDV